MSEWSANSTTEAARIWAIFSGMYGTRLTRDFGESVPEVWKQAIAKMSRNELERGLRRLTIGGSGSPPTLPQFVRACKMVGDDNGEARPASTFEAALPDGRDRFDGCANQALLGFMLANHVENNRLPELLPVKNKLAADYRLLATEVDVEGDEMLIECRKQFARVWATKAAA